MHNSLHVPFAKLDYLRLASHCRYLMQAAVFDTQIKRDKYTGSMSADCKYYLVSCSSSPYSLSLTPDTCFGVGQRKPSQCPSWSGINTSRADTANNVIRAREIPVPKTGSNFSEAIRARPVVASLCNVNVSRFRLKAGSSPSQPRPISEGRFPVLNFGKSQLLTCIRNG
jgi:hypothetical protein